MLGLRVLPLITLLLSSCSKEVCDLPSTTESPSNPHLIEEFKHSDDLAHIISFRNYIFGFNGEYRRGYSAVHSFDDLSNLHVYQIYEASYLTGTLDNLCSDAEDWDTKNSCVVDTLQVNRDLKFIQYFEGGIWRVQLL